MNDSLIADRVAVRVGRPTPLRAWLAATRPKTLAAAVAPVAVGTALAVHDGQGRPLFALAALIGALLIQIGTNLVNDWADWRSGVDGAGRLGPPRATQQGWLTPRQVAAGALLSFGGAAAIGALLVWRGGWPVLLLGLLSVLCGAAYTAGPLPLGYHGLGEPAVLLFFGPVAVGGSYYVQALRIDAPVLWASLPVGLLACALLVVNNVRDHDTDRRAGKRTFAARHGARAGRWEYTALLAATFAVTPALWLAGTVGDGWLLPLAALPLAALELQRFWQREGAALNASLGGTARLGLVYGLLLAAGVLQ